MDSTFMLKIYLLISLRKGYITIIIANNILSFKSKLIFA